MEGGLPQLELQFKCCLALEKVLDLSSSFSAFKSEDNMSTYLRMMVEEALRSFTHKCSKQYLAYCPCSENVHGL